MAANDCYLPIPIKFLHTSENSFYFQEVETGSDLEEDVFEISPHEPLTFWIQSREQKFLIMTEKNLQVCNLDVLGRKQPECKFHIQIYHDSSSDLKVGRPVMLYSNKDIQKMVVCCRDEKEVYPEPMDLPENIDGTGHKALFCRRKISNDRYMFESTVYKKRFLAFERDSNLPSVMKLILYPKVEDEVDECCEIIVSEVTK